MPTVAIVTCAALPDLDDDERLILAPLKRRGITAVPAVWDDPGVDWDGFDATVIRCPWDYQDRREEFLAWASTVPRLHNPAEILRWSTDKRYLGELAAAGVPVVPTTRLPPGTDIELPSDGEWVFKPSVGAGSREAGRYRMDETRQRELAQAHVARLHAARATVIVQPYMPEVDSSGEISLIYIDGSYSHAIRKSAMLDGPYRQDVGLYKDETITAATASDIERKHAGMAVEAVGRSLLYARVDLVPNGGGPLLLELELAEPSLFYAHGPGSADRMAAAIASRV